MQEVYPTSQKPRRYRICFVFNMRFGGPLVCILWLGLHLYGSIMSFQKISPIYSYLHNYALIAQGVSCIVFCLLSIFSLYCFGDNSPQKLRGSHRWTWFAVMQFLLCYFVNMIVFCTQKPQFDAWCINKSRQDTTSYIFSTSPNNSTLLPDSQLYFKSRGNGLSLYNCTRLWEDEVKFSVVVFVILFTFYVHFALCFWRYTQVRMLELESLAFEMATQLRMSMNSTNMMNNNMMNNNSNMMNNNSNMMNNNNTTMNNNMMNINNTMTPNTNTNMMRNLAPTSKENVQEDNQKSLAQLARAVLGRWR